MARPEHRPESNCMSAGWWGEMCAGDPPLFCKEQGQMFQTSCLTAAQWWNLRWLESVCSSICIDATRIFFVLALKIVQDLDYHIFQKSQIHVPTVRSGFSWSFQTFSQSEKLVPCLPGAAPLQWAGVKHHLAIYYHYLNWEIQQRNKTDHAALFFYLHWHCPLATHPGRVTSLSHSVWIISIFDGCATDG